MPIPFNITKLILSLRELTTLLAEREFHVGEMVDCEDRMCMEGDRNKFLAKTRSKLHELCFPCSQS